MKTFRTGIVAAVLSLTLQTVPTLDASDNEATSQPKAASVAVPADVKPAANLTAAETVEPRPCHWWQRRKNCGGVAVEGLPDGVPRQGVVVTIDATHNSVYLFKDGELLGKGPAATGSDKVLKKGLRIWKFYTPRGRMKILKKIEDPVWVKPDWAFVEEGKKIPPIDSPERRVNGKLGRYALHLGDGIMIHGTKDIESLGKKASHGCIRLSDEMLELVYQNTDVGTAVYVF